MLARMSRRTSSSSLQATELGHHQTTFCPRPLMATPTKVLEIEGRSVTITNPEKVFFPKTGHTKLDLVNYYLAVVEGAIRGVDGRPMAMKRFVNGAESEPFFQKRVPASRPEWIETVDLSYPSGRTASE